MAIGPKGIGLSWFEIIDFGPKECIELLFFEPMAFGPKEFRTSIV